MSIELENKKLLRMEQLFHSMSKSLAEFAARRRQKIF